MNLSTTFDANTAVNSTRNLGTTYFQAIFSGTSDFNLTASAQLTMAPLGTVIECSYSSYAADSATLPVANTTGM